jgi:hypothetical protein
MAGRSTTVRMSLSISTKLKQFVRKTKGEHLRLGDYMEALDQAAILYMKNRDLNTHTQTHESKSNIPPKIVRIRDKVIAYLQSEHNYEGFGYAPVRVSLKHLRQGIIYARDCKNEDRTVIPWIKEFIHYEIISEVQTGVYEFIFEGKKSENNLKQKQIEDEINSVFN